MCAQVDVYSFAMICYQLFECVPPFWWQDPIEAARGAAMQHKRPTWGAVNRAKVVVSVMACLMWSVGWWFGSEWGWWFGSEWVGGFGSEWVGGLVQSGVVAIYRVSHATHAVLPTHMQMQLILQSMQPMLPMLQSMHHMQPMLPMQPMQHMLPMQPMLQSMLQSMHHMRPMRSTQHMQHMLQSMQHKRPTLGSGGPHKSGGQRGEHVHDRCSTRLQMY